MREASLFPLVKLGSVFVNSLVMTILLNPVRLLVDSLDVWERWVGAKERVVLVERCFQPVPYDPLIAMAQNSCWVFQRNSLCLF